ncbi:SagB family peptide dehydrogenase [Kitasatospora sp. NBC_00070]|uniref:SagB family peptide dehydrogenase n=1 Tax=Kitasatospora sp. NBC_00070 TaxID=2975962 RepID=UPI003246C393
MPETDVIVSPDPEELAPRRLWSLREDVHVELPDPGGDVLLHSRWQTERVVRPDRTTREALRRMRLGPVSLRNVLDGAEDGAEERLSRALHGIQHLIVRSIGMTGSQSPLLSFVPMSPRASLDLPRVTPDRPVRLSRFAHLHSEGRGFELESPLSLFRVTAHRGAGAELLASLGWTATPEELLKTVPLPRAVVLELLAHLLAAGLVITDEDRGAEPESAFAEPTFAEDSDPVLATWSPVDLLFHTRSTTGRHDHDFGATFTHALRLLPEPAIRPLPDGPRFPLPAVRGTADDPAPLAAALDAGPRPLGPGPAGELTTTQIGELLHRSLRVRSVSADPTAPAAYQVSDRPYTSISGSHPLEAYLTVTRCAGLPPGIFHYDPAGHQLTLVNRNETDLAEFLTCIRTAGGLTEAPPATITLTARFSRVTWKFSALGYALVLRDTGAALQTLTLAATVMGLTTAVLGNSDADLAPRCVGLDWRSEAPVGQLIIDPSHAPAKGRP